MQGTLFYLKTKKVRFYLMNIILFTNCNNGSKLVCKRVYNKPYYKVLYKKYIYKTKEYKVCFVRLYNKNTLDNIFDSFMFGTCEIIRKHKDARYKQLNTELTSYKLLDDKIY